MPIEIRELIIEGSLAKFEQQGEDRTELPTGKDLEALKEELLATIQSSGNSSGQQREFRESILREVRRMLDERWRR